MRIVLATHTFDQVGGSETYLLTVAEQLQRLGHGVTVYALALGKMAELARARGVEVAPEGPDLGTECDVIVSQDGVVAHELADRFPKAPQVFVCHSTLYDLQLPPLAPGVVSAVIALSDRVERRMRAMDVNFRVLRLRQPIDVERLMPRGAPRERPRRALLLGNHLCGEGRDILVEAWSAMGIEVVQLGLPTTVTLHPEEDIARADIVVGKGRAILDAMSCGRPAYVYDAFGTDGWVTPETYPLMEADAFAGQALPRVADRELLRRDLSQYDRRMGQANREIITKHHQARMHADQIALLCKELVPNAPANTTPNRELARLIRSKSRAEFEAIELRTEVGKLRTRAVEAERSVYQRKLRTGLRRGEAWVRSIRDRLFAAVRKR